MILTIYEMVSTAESFCAVCAKFVNQVKLKCTERHCTLGPVRWYSGAVVLGGHRVVAAPLKQSPATPVIKI